MTTNPVNPEDRERLLNQGDDPDWQPVEKREKCRPVMPGVPDAMLEVYLAAGTLVAHHREYYHPTWCWCASVGKPCPWCRLVAAVKADEESRARGRAKAEGEPE